MGRIRNARAAWSIQYRRLILRDYVPSAQAVHLLLAFDIVAEAAGALKPTSGGDAYGYLNHKIDQIVIDGGSALWSAAGVVRNSRGMDGLRVAWCAIHRLRAARKAFRSITRSARPLGPDVCDAAHIGIYNTPTLGKPPLSIYSGAAEGGRYYLRVCHFRRGLQGRGKRQRRTWRTALITRSVK